MNKFMQRSFGVVVGCFGLAVVPNVSAVYASSVISGSQIIPSTSLPAITIPSVNSFTIDQIADGITTDVFPYNGFASTAASGTITLNLVNQFDLDSFILWNDINVFQEGIKDFRLDFFNTSNILISSSPIFTAPVGLLSPTSYPFPTVFGVSRVDLVVLNSHPGTFERIEIREVEFTGSPTVTAVPEPSSLLGIVLSGIVMLFTKFKIG